MFHGGAHGITSGDPSTAAAQLESDQVGAHLGVSVASAGDVNGDGYADVIVGSPLYDSGQTDEGAAFVFLGSATGIAGGNASTASAQIKSGQTSANLGESVASAGDVNGDGYADVIVGVAGYDSGQTDEGAAFVFHGSAAGIASGTPLATAHTQIESDQPVARLGYRAASAGDVNGDGYADVIVGAPFYDSGQTSEGAAFIFHGSAVGIASGTPLATAHTQIESDQDYANLGRSVATAGDVNGDGYADVIVGASGYSAGQMAEGAAFILHGGAAGIASGTAFGTAHTQIESDQDYAILGGSVASAGDVNGDGYADVIVGSELYESGQMNEGTAFVFLGSAGGIASGTALGTAHTQIESDQDGARLGSSVASAGDVNGDGYADVIIGASYYNAGYTGEGAAFVFHGNSSGRPVLPRQRRGDGSGVAVAPWGEALDGDGFTFELRASHPSGTGRVRGEIEACSPGVPFGGASCESALTSEWVAVGGSTSEVVLSEGLSGLTSDTLYRWRARVLHAPLTGPLPAAPAHGPWLRPTAQSAEADIRVGGGAPAACSDSLDNDGDGFTDWPSDPGCADASDGSERSASLPCDDGTDNDGDGHVDYVDLAADGGISDPPGDPACKTPSFARENAQCQDGVNNDGATGTDWDGGESILGAGNGDPNGADPECASQPWRDQETPYSTCGLGAELALVLPLLAALGRRRGGRRGAIG